MIRQGGRVKKFVGPDGLTYRKALPKVPVAVGPPLNTTFTIPKACAPVTAVIVVSLGTATEVAATPPRVTLVTPVSPRPRMVIGVPPAVGP